MKTKLLSSIFFSIMIMSAGYVSCKKVCGLVVPFAIENNQKWFLFALYKGQNVFNAFSLCVQAPAYGKDLASKALTTGTYNQYRYTEQTLQVCYWKRYVKGDTEYYMHIAQVGKRVAGSTLYKSKREPEHVVDYVWFTEDELKNGNQKIINNKAYIIDQSLYDFMMKSLSEIKSCAPSSGSPLPTKGGWYTLGKDAIYFDRSYDHLLAPGNYFWLTNFYDAPFEIGKRWSALEPNKLEVDKIVVQNTEIYFQAQKFMTTMPQWADQILTMKTADQAFNFVNKDLYLGKKKDIFRRKDWFTINIPLMLDSTRAKYVQNTSLAQKLLATGDKILVEQTKGRSIPDEFWGAGENQGYGNNALGQILMHVRNELKAQKLLDCTVYKNIDWIRVNVNKELLQPAPLSFIPAYPVPYPQPINPEIAGIGRGTLGKKAMDEKLLEELVRVLAQLMTIIV